MFALRNTSCSPERQNQSALMWRRNWKSTSYMLTYASPRISISSLSLSSVWVSGCRHLHTFMYVCCVCVCVFGCVCVYVFVHSICIPNCICLCSVQVPFWRAWGHTTCPRLTRTSSRTSPCIGPPCGTLCWTGPVSLWPLPTSTVWPSLWRCGTTTSTWCRVSSPCQLPVPRCRIFLMSPHCIWLMVCHFFFSLPMFVVSGWIQQVFIS